MAYPEYIPAEYTVINEYNAFIKPSTVHLKDNRTFYYYAKYLLEELFSVFDFDGIPDEWNYDFFRYALFVFGSVGVFETDKYGVIFMNGMPFGRGLYYQPTHYVITNPLLKGITRPEIGVECEIIRMQPNWSGIGDLISYYASMMALTTESAVSNLMNTKLAYVFMAKDKAQAQSFKKMFDNINSGDPAAFADEKLFDADGNPRWMMFNQDLKNTYITPEIMSDLHRWKNLFLTDIGIPNANFEKSERLITNEVNANNTETLSKAKLWKDEIDRCLKKVNDMFDLDLSVSLRYPDTNTTIKDREVMAYEQ